MAALWMAGAVLSFTAMGISARELGDTMSPFQILLLRNLFGVAFILLLVARTDPTILRWSDRRLHLVRHTIHFAGQVTWILALVWLPLALVFAVEFTSPIWGSLVAVWLLGEALGRHRVAALLLGFVGVLVIVRPGLTGFDLAMLTVLAAALAFGVTNALTKKLLATDRPWTILFWMCLTQSLMSLPLALPLWAAPVVADLPWIAMVGISGLSAHYCLSRALALADASVVLPMEFARVPLAAVIGLVAYGEPFDPWILLGAVVIFAGIWINLRGERRS